MKNISRRIARENAFLSAFEESFHLGEITSIINYSREEGENKVDEFGEKLITNMVDNREEIDGIIEPHLKDWKLSRIPRVCRVMMELAVAEMMCSDESISIIINEAVEITKKFAHDEDYQLLNGVLGTIAKENFKEKLAVDANYNKICLPSE